MSEYLGSAVLELRADDAPLGRDMDGAHRTVGAGMQRMGAGLAKSGAILTAGLTLPIVAFGKMAGEELTSIEQANNLTAASLRRMGKDSLVTVDGVQKLAGELQRTSGLDDQLIQMGQNAILSFGAIDTSTREGARNFAHASRVMVNFAEQTGTSVDTAGKQIAKSMAAASQGVLLLPKGIKLAGPEQERLKKYLDSGASAADKQAAVMEVLGKKVEGAANLTNADKWAILKDRFAGIGAELLTRLRPVGEHLITMLGSVLGVLENMGPTTSTVVAGVVAFAAALGPLLGMLGAGMMVLPAVGAALGALIGPIGLVIVAIGAMVAAGIYLWRHSEAFRDAVTAAWESVRVGVMDVLAQLRATINQWVVWGKAIWKEYGDQISAMARLAWSFLTTYIGGQLKIIQGIITTVLAVLRGDWGEAWHGIKMVLSGTWDAMTALVRTALTALKNAATAAWEDIRESAATKWDQVKAAVVNRAESIANGVGKAFGGIAGDLAEKGREAGSQFANAIKDAINAVLDKIRSIELPSIKVAGKTIGGGKPFGGLPRLARGGITDGVSIAGEAGPEAVVPLGSSLRNRMDRDRVLADAGLAPRGGGVTQHFHFTGLPDMFTVAQQAAFQMRTAGLTG